MAVQQDFDEAVAYIQNLPKDGPVKPSNDEKLKFYGLFKQAKEGDVKDGRPGIFSGLEAGYKWDAWNSRKGMSKEEAMKAYAECVAEIKKKYAA